MRDEPEGPEERLSPFEEIEEEEKPLDPEELDRITEEQPVEVDYRALKLSLLGLGLLLVFQAFQVWSWNRQKSSPPSRQEAVHLEIASVHRSALREGKLLHSLFRGPGQGLPAFPPLYHLSVMPVLDCPDPAKAALWVNLFYLGILCLACWALGHHFAGEWAGLGVAVLVSCTPAVQSLLLECGPDLALMAWVVAGYWALSESRSFQVRRYSVLFGAFVAAGMWTKWTAFTYFLPVLWVGAKVCLRYRRRILNVLLAAVTFLLLAAPWYIPEGASYLPYLWEASRGGVPVWRDWSIFAYLAKMAGGMELPFFLTGFAAVVVRTKRRRWEDTWILFAWLVSTYLFWSLVPNRQMRFLLPAVPSLAVLAMGPWTRRLLIGLCAFQLLSAANYSRGWVPHIEFEAGVPLSVFRSHVPKREDWRLEKILRTAAEHHRQDLPIGTLSVLAAHPSFDFPGFRWERSRLGLEGIRVGEMGRRGPEFGEFVVTKSGELGPPEFAGRLPALRDELLERNSWFLRGYRSLGSWKLPDESRAVLYQRRRFPHALFAEGKAYYAYYQEGDWAAEGMRIDFGRWDPDCGCFPRVRLRAKGLVYKGVRVKGISAELDGLSITTYRKPRLRDPAWMRDQLAEARVLRLDRIRLLSASASEKSAERFVQLFFPGARHVHAAFDGGFELRAWFHWIPLSLRGDAVFEEDSGALVFHLEGIRIFWLPVPVFSLGPLSGYRIDLAPEPGRPFYIETGRVDFRGGRMTCSGGPGRG